MAGSLQPRAKTWSAKEDVVYSDLNAEFDNVLLAMQPLLMDDYSTDVTQMQVTADPGEVGTESKATTLAGELARLRFMVKEITGENQWYESPIASLTGLANAIGTGLTANRIVSGRTRGTSAQPVFLVPNGAARTVKVDGTPTNFIYYVDGVEYTISSDVSLTGLTAAPASNNTCLVNIAGATAQDFTKYLGENGTEIAVDNMGSSITALVGQFAAFKTSTECFFAYVASSTQLTKARRGYFFDSTDAPLTRVGLTDNDTITLLKLTWIFARTDGTLTATYNNPTWADDEPTSPSVGDFWYDTSANQWKTYSVGSFSAANATLIGVCAQDTSACIAARSFDRFGNYDSLNTIELFAESNSQVKSRWPGSIVNAYGTTQHYDFGLVTWDMTLDLDSGVTEGSSTYYYFYITEAGDKVISDTRPYDRAEDLLGWYHPHHSWRCVGYAFNNASSNLEQVESFFDRYPAQKIRSVISTDTVQPLDEINTLSGASYTIDLPPAAYNRGRILTFAHGGTSLSQIYTLDGYSSETINGSTTVKLHTNGQTLRIISTGSNWLIVSHYCRTGWNTIATTEGVWITATTTAPEYADSATQYARWRRDGNCAEVIWFYRQTATTGATAGSGVYLINLPSGLTIDTNIVTVNTATGIGAASYDSALGTWHGAASTTTNFTGTVIAYSTTQLKVHSQTETTTGGGDTGLWGSAHQPFNGSAAAAYGFRASIPVVDWLP